MWFTLCCSDCTVTALLQGKIRQRTKDVSIGQLFIQNNNSHDKTEQ